MVDRVFHEVLEWIYAIVIALAIAIVVHTFLIQPTRVSGESMVPTLHNGEYLLISDTLAFHDGKVWRNGEALDEPYINEPMEYSRKGEITIPDGYVFCMGDNRNHSSDSRFIGPVPIDHVLGTVIW